MKEEQMNNVIRIRIIELEDKLMDLIELSSKYEHIPVPVFEMDAILKQELKKKLLLDFPSMNIFMYYFRYILLRRVLKSLAEIII